MMLNTIKIRNITFLLVFLPSLFIFANEALANKLNLSTQLLKQGYQEMPIPGSYNMASLLCLFPLLWNAFLLITVRDCLS